MPPDPNLGGNETPIDPTVPTEPAEPTVPEDPLAEDPTGGFGDAVGDWWMSLGV